MYYYFLLCYMIFALIYFSVVSIIDFWNKLDGYNIEPMWENIKNNILESLLWPVMIFCILSKK